MQQLSLVSALLSIASGISGRQLIRFARSVLGARAVYDLEKQSSNVRRVEWLARELIRLGKLDEALFDRLEAMNPQAHELVERARAEWQSEQNTSGSSSAEPPPGVEPPPSTNVPEEAEVVRWREQIRKRVASISPSQREPPVWLLNALSLLPSFDPVALIRNPIVRQQADVSNLLTDVAAIADPRSDGRWAVKPEKRRGAIRAMTHEDSLRDAINIAERLAQGEEAEPYLAILRDFLHDGPVHVRPSWPQSHLLAAREIGAWFKDSSYAPVNADRVATILAAREQIEPLRKLVGSHFRGRAQELALLSAPHGFGPEHYHVLVLTGVGGVGKSALLGKHMLNLLDQSPPPPVVYVDFDRSEAEPANARRMIELIARSLTLNYAGTEQEFGFAALESVSAGDTDAGRFEVVLPQSADDATLLHVLAARVRQLPRSHEALFIFDTFEQVMRRGPTVVARFTDFLRSLLQELPFARSILSGRGQIDVPILRYEHSLQELDADSADGVLEARGVDDAAVRQKLIQALGTSPLMLRIGSAALLKGQLHPEKLDLFAAGAARLRLQGMLYSRVLGHLGDPQVERLAHPGLVVRRITPGVIRSVLADICQIEPASADDLFTRLPDFVELFEPDESAPGEERALRHRQDLREDVLDVMINDPAWAAQIETIHRRALKFYIGRQDPVGRAEALYHSIMLNEDQERLDELWSADLAVSLGRSWSDPIPERARQWLAHRLGMSITIAAGELRLLDWEERAARAARSSLDAGEAKQALDQLRERMDRTRQSPCTLVEMEALAALDRRPEALDVARMALSRASVDAPRYRRDVLLSAAEIALTVGDLPAARAFATEAADLAKALADERSRIRALELCARAEQGASHKELEQVFIGANTNVLRSDALTVARVVESVGRESRDVLIKAAETFAYDPDHSLLTSDPTVWRSLLQTVAEHAEGKTMLSSFARRVGLPSSQADPLSVATGMVKHGLHSEALAAVLGTFGDDRKIREQSVAIFQGPGHVL